MLTLTFIAVALVLWIIYRIRWFSAFKELGVPGPEPSIFFGNLVEFVTKAPIQCLDDWFKKYGKVVGYYFGTIPVVIVADVDLLKKIQISDFNKFINRASLFQPTGVSKKSKKPRDFTQHLIAMRDKRWKEVRSIITPSFTASKMKQLAPIMNSAIDSLLNNVEKKCVSGVSFDIYPLYQGLTMDVIGRTAFGIQSDAQNNPNDPLLRSSRAILANDVRNNWFFVFASSFRSLAAVWIQINRLRLSLRNKGINPFKELMKSVRDIVALRRKDKESRRIDLLQLMMDAEIDDSSTITSEDLTASIEKEKTKQSPGSSSSYGKLVRKMTDNDIVDNAALFFIAAYETTSTALAFATHFLIHYQEAQDRIREEVQDLLKTEGVLDYYSVNKLQYLEQVLMESLRLYPPVSQFATRECGEDVEVGNYKLKKGMAIQVPAYHIQRDPDIWGPDANEFNPDRFSPENKSKIHPMAFQSFGAGPRNCVGMRFAYMEEKLALARLLSKYKLKLCPETDKLEITLKLTAAGMNPKLGIWAKAVPVN